MIRLLQCFKQLLPQCPARTLLSKRKLFWSAVLLYGLFIFLAFSFNIIETFSDRFVHQRTHFSDNIKPILSKVTAIHSLKNVTSSASSTQELLEPKPTTKDKNEIIHTESSSPHNCHSWCRSKENASKPFFLTAVLLVRIYFKDLAQLTTRELRQWMYYLRYAGFEHVYVYDAYVMKSESQAQALKSLIDEGFVTYTDWSHRAYPYSISGTQVSAYQDCITRFGRDSLWQAAIDIDEYPFSPTDNQPFFVQRAVKELSKSHPAASELTMQNYLFLGKPLDDNKRPLLMDRIWRRTHGPANPLVKPIYRPLKVRHANVHHNHLAHGHTVNFAVDLLRMNHYWGARLQNWGDDTPEIIEKTQPDNLMKPIVKILQDCASQCVPSSDYLYRKQWN